MITNFFFSFMRMSLINHGVIMCDFISFSACLFEDARNPLEVGILQRNATYIQINKQTNKQTNKCSINKL